MLASKIYTINDAGVIIKISLTRNEEMPKNSAMPPQTPCSEESVDDFVSRLVFTSAPPAYFIFSIFLSCILHKILNIIEPNYPAHQNPSNRLNKSYKKEAVT